ncbi:MAG: sprT domain-containing protein [Flavobacteriales bacterium]|nr:sprT domain-containing protein [Flavobacteriales bacterium]
MSIFIIMPKLMSSFHSFVPKSSIPLLECWIAELDLDVRISKPRRSKLGDFKVVKNRMVVTINNNLNTYSFLITIVHELAHAFVFREYGNSVPPHGNNWKAIYKSMMLNFLSPTFFPKDILKVLSGHMVLPKASTYSDIELVKVLKKYDDTILLTISDIQVGELFKLSNGRSFIKGVRLRKRFRCIEEQTNKVYLFHPFSEVIRG